MTKLILVMALTIAVMVLTTGCTTYEQPSAPGLQAGVTSCHPTFFGNSTYYFPCVGNPFIQELSRFAGTHSIVDVCGDGTWGYGYDRGYYVIAKEKLI